MNKVATLVFVVSALAGCETSKQAYSMVGKGTAAFSCEEITKAFTAYKADRESTAGLAVIAPLISASAGDISSSVLTTSDEYFNQAKSSANSALSLQGCSPII